jgi:hypothetical protein
VCGATALTYCVEVRDLDEVKRRSLAAPPCLSLVSAQEQVHLDSGGSPGEARQPKMPAAGEYHSHSNLARRNQAPDGAFLLSADRMVSC